MALRPSELVCGRKVKEFGVTSSTECCKQSWMGYSGGSPPGFQLKCREYGRACEVCRQNNDPGAGLQAIHVIFWGKNLVLPMSWSLEGIWVLKKLTHLFGEEISAQHSDCGMLTGRGAERGENVEFFKKKITKPVNIRDVQLLNLPILISRCKQDVCNC